MSHLYKYQEQEQVLFNHSYEADTAHYTAHGLYPYMNL